MDCYSNRRQAPVDDIDWLNLLLPAVPRLHPSSPGSGVAATLAGHVQRLYSEAGGTAKIHRGSIGAGTDAAFAALTTKAPVIEGMGLRNFGAHTNNAEYINISSIEPRLYLLTRLISSDGTGVPSGRLVISRTWL